MAEMCCSTDHKIDIPTCLPLVLKQERGIRKRKASRLKEVRQPPCKEVKVKKQRDLNEGFFCDSEEAMTDSNDSNSPAF